METIENLEKTQIRNELLKNLLIGGDGFDGFLNGGHTQESRERQLLSYIVLQAMKVVRFPYMYDFKAEKKVFEGFSEEEMNSAVIEAQRIYNHTQEQFQRLELKSKEVVLRRGLRDIEAAVLNKIVDLIPAKEVNYFFQTITFFNYRKESFAGHITLKLNCPIDWIWCSTYTVKDFERFENIDDEFLVVNKEPNGCLKIPKTSIQITNNPIFRPRKLEFNSKHQPLDLIFSYLTREPLCIYDHYDNPFYEYRLGKFESRFLKWARYLDERFSSLFERSRLMKKRKSLNEDT